jgi:quercetin dioxygenase-like cupin family protein
MRRFESLEPSPGDASVIHGAEAIEASTPEAQYVSVSDVDYQLAEGCTKTFRKALLRTRRLAIHQTSIRGRGAAEFYGVCSANRAAYVLAGHATLKRPNDSDLKVEKGHLIVIPAGAEWGNQLSVLSDELVLLEVARAVESESASDATCDRTALVHAVRPEDVVPYEPAGHAKTTNRCLFADEHVEIIEGRIERGGGADRHAHRHNEQMLYVLGNPSTPLFIFYPEGAPHGTGGGIPEPLELLVIYSPPLGESKNALA